MTFGSFCGKNARSCFPILWKARPKFRYETPSQFFRYLLNFFHCNCKIAVAHFKIFQKSSKNILVTFLFTIIKLFVLQVLFGLGLPMEGEVSMTLGYVLKCNYRLPYNASDFSDGPYVRYARATHPDNLNLPQASPETGAVSRWSLYRMLAMALEPGGSRGKACVLRAVCESAESPLGEGVLSEILHVFLTPSTTSEEYEIYGDREYDAAEKIGRHSSGDACQIVYHECPYSPLNYFTTERVF
ncbi:uncharacterized protein [Venturia canescens]|uniref:uncharacterized protein n=1 Tax=Venturia canescens TaxID=32260 RepID=UPI001C9C6699|nr:uncharacterized protein LOC122418455 [Venturia canescens]